jgi:hypothetical protein
MDISKLGLSAGETELLSLGADLGQNQTLGQMRGYCGAARAAVFQRLKEQQMHKRFNLSWDEFCPAVLGHSRTDVDRQIALLNEFGPRYFAVSELAPVSAENFRMLESSVKDDALMFDGEAIPLNRENAQKVANAVAILRRRAKGQAAPPAGTTLFDEVQSLGRRAQSVIESFETLSVRTPDSPAYIEFGELLEKTRGALKRINQRT